MKNKFLNFLVNTFKSGCVIFTFIVFLFYILGNMMASTVQVLNLTNLFLLFLFSIVFALANLILKSKKMNIVLRVALHFITMVAGFFVIFVYLPGNLQKGSSAFVLTVVFTVLYALVTAVILTVRHFIKKRKTDKQEYSSVYDKAKNGENN